MKNLEQLKKEMREEFRQELLYKFNPRGSGATNDILNLFEEYLGRVVDAVEAEFGEDYNNGCGCCHSYILSEALKEFRGV